MIGLMPALVQSFSSSHRPYNTVIVSRQRGIPSSKAARTSAGNWLARSSRL